MKTPAMVMVFGWFAMFGCGSSAGNGVTGVESNCGNKVDDDGDGATDCDDSDCSGASACGGGPVLVECAHPGAGAPMGGACECVNTFEDVTGMFLERYRCLEGTTCEDPPLPSTMVISAVGGDLTNLEADDQGTDWFVAGRYCGNVFEWSGGSVEEEYTETGTWTFSSANAFKKESDYMYIAGGGGYCEGNGARESDPGSAGLDSVCTN